MILSKQRNPAWNREELILALDAYVRWDGSPPNKTSNEITALSSEIGALRRSIGAEGDQSLRNVNGSYMKLMNFRRFDPRFQEQGRVGLTRGNKLEEVVWREFHADPARLRRVADAIRASISATESQITNPARDMIAEDLAPMPSGRREYVREIFLRNRRHVAELKELYGGRCQVSGKVVLDGIAGDITEVHHIEWLTRGGADVPGNMVVISPDIHAAIHASDAIFDWSDLAFVVNGVRLPLTFNQHLKRRTSENT